jgi:hypothetical protein
VLGLDEGEKMGLVGPMDGGWSVCADVGMTGGTPSLRHPAPFDILSESAKKCVGVVLMGVF